MSRGKLAKLLAKELQTLNSSGVVSLEDYKILRDSVRSIDTSLQKKDMSLLRKSISRFCRVFIENSKNRGRKKNQR